MSSMPYYPHAATNTVNLDISKLSQGQIQTIVNKLSTHIRSPEPPVLISHVSITKSGVMARTSSYGIFLTISSNFRYENHSFTFQHHCISSLQSSLPNGSWIVDSGASSHVCCDLSQFIGINLVSGITVTLPNGTSLPILHTSTIKLYDSLFLYDILHVLTFHFNLISVSSLLHDNNCSHVQFIFIPHYVFFRCLLRA